MNKINTCERNYDVIIIGGGIVGLCVAYQLITKKITNKILIIDKEKELGMHSSGRNSGVIHAGLYYKPNTMKAKVCVEGGKRLLEWADQRGIVVKRCGKLIVPTEERLDGQLDILKDRGEANGALVELWNENDIKKKYSYVRSASGRAIWSPNTAVIKPLEIIKTLQRELQEKKVEFRMDAINIRINRSDRYLQIENEKYGYGHIFNCAGLYADKIAKQMNTGNKYRMMPFKGLYWKLKNKCNIKPDTNIYPVPDLNIPFLGVHFTPSAHSESEVYIGPTATLALGRENYKNILGIEPIQTIENITTLAIQYVANKGGIRKYMSEQAFLNIPQLLIAEAKKIIPELTLSDIEISNKVAIRPQLYNIEEKELEKDFICVAKKTETHVLNAISPAFTASFELADLIINESKINVDQKRHGDKIE